MASSILLRILGQSDDAERSIRDIATDVAALDRQSADVNVDVDTAAASGQLALFASEVSALDGKEIDVSVDVDRGAFAALAGLQAGLKAAADAAGGGGGGGGGLGIAIRSINFGPLSVGSSGASAAVLVLAAAIGVTLIGALAALAASAAGAVAAIGVLAVAFAGALGPAVALAIGVVSRLAAVFAVLKAEDQARTQAAKQSAAGDQQAVAAMDRRRAAAQSLADAEQASARARAQAFRELADAAEAAEDAVLSLERAQLSEEQAALGIRQAELELRRFREQTKLVGNDVAGLFRKFTDVDVQFDASALSGVLQEAGGGDLGADQQLKLEQLVLNVRDARLREREAIDGVGDAERNLGRARSANQRFQQQGINASEQYTAALRAERDARRQVAVAARDPRTPAAVANVTALTGELSDTERRLLDVIRKVRDTFHAAFGPAVQAVLRGIITALNRINRVAPGLSGAFKRLGVAVGRSIGTLATELTRPALLKAFRDLTIAAARLAGPIAVGIGALARAFTNIAVAASGPLRTALVGVVGLLGRFATATGDTDRLSKTIGMLVDHLYVWLQVGAAVARIFLAFFRAAAPMGRAFAAAIARAGNALATWMESDEGRREIQNFLKVAVPLALELTRFFFRFVVLLGRIGQIAAPILTPILRTLSTMISVITTLLGKLTALARGFGVVLEAVHSVMRKIIEFLAGLYGKFFDLGANLIKGLVKGILSLADKAVGAVKGIAGDIVKGAGDIFKIGSPSRVFMGIGQDVSDGLRLGLERSAGALAVAATTTLATPVLAAGPTAASSTSRSDNRRVLNQKMDVSLTVPGGGNPDPRALLSFLEREAAGRGWG